MRIKRTLEKMSVPLLSILIAMLIGSAVILVCGYSPIAAYSSLFRGAFGSLRSCMGTLEKCVPLIFCGLAAMVAFKSGIFNIGLEGQVVVGAIAYILTGLNLQFLPLPFHVLVCSIFALLAGGLWALIAGAMKVYCRANEVVSTIMLNYIALNLAEYLFSGPFMAEGTIPQSEALETEKLLPAVWEGSKITWAFVIASCMILFIGIFYRYTVAGYNMIAAGDNDKAAEAGGIRMNQTRLMSMAMSGAIAGIAGGLLVAATYGRYVIGMSSGYGFDGMAIAVLGQNSAAGVFLSSILFGGLRTGSLSMAMFEGIPSELVSILQGLIILTVSAPLLIKSFRIKGRRKKQ